MHMHRKTTIDQSGVFTCQAVPPTRPVLDMAQEVREGLLAPPRWLSPKYFYDARGSRLFDRICATAEYYVTRTENALLAHCARTVITRANPQQILELGSGASRKTHHLLDACEAEGLTCTYWAFDVCETMLHETARRLMADYAWLDIHALVGDYLAGLDALPRSRERRLIMFLGSTIGNFTPKAAVSFLQELRTLMHEGDTLLLGADRVKDTAVLQAAYNDSAGITAAFNLNILNVLNRELRADFDLDGFTHQACYNAAEQRIEMRLCARYPQSVHLDALDEPIAFAADETILTEISCKFTPADLHRLITAGGFTVDAHFQPANGYFSLLLLRPSTGQSKAASS